LVARSSLSQLIDEKVTKKLRLLKNKTSNYHYKIRVAFGGLVILAAIVLKLFDLMDDWPSFFLAVFGGVLLTGEKITDTLSAWKGKK